MPENQRYKNKITGEVGSMFKLLDDEHSLKRFHEWCEDNNLVLIAKMEIRGRLFVNQKFRHPFLLTENDTLFYHAKEGLAVYSSAEFEILFEEIEASEKMTKVNRLQQYQLKPNRISVLKLSRDPDVLDRATRWCGGEIDTGRSMNGVPEDYPIWLTVPSLEGGVRTLVTDDKYLVQDQDLGRFSVKTQTELDESYEKVGVRGRPRGSSKEATE